jgi:hypothetical protein
MIALEEDEETETLATSPQVAAKPALSRDEYIARAYEHLGALIVWAKDKGIPAVEAEAIASKVFDWVMKDYERSGDNGAPYSRLRAYMAREIERFGHTRKCVIKPTEDIDRAVARATRRTFGGRVTRHKGAE